MKEFHRGDFANRTGLAQAWTVKSADRLFTDLAQMVHAISRNFTIRDTNQIVEQLILRCQTT